MMNFDFSHLYRTETVDIERDDVVLFQVTIREIPHGDIAANQNNMFKQFDIDLSSVRNGGFNQDIMRSMNNSIKSGALEVSSFNDNQKLMGIESWTLTNKDGSAVPVGIEAWNNLPHWITEQIEEAVERLNPKLDDSFRSD